MSATVSAQSTGETWKQAANAYQEENYTTALSLYQLVEIEVSSDDLFQNIGNCYYKLDSVAQAILYYEKALKRNPRNGEVTDNLELARSKMDEPVIRLEPFFLVRWVNGLALALSPLMWGLVSLILLWLIAYAYSRVIRTRRQLRLRERIVPILILIMIFFLGYISYYQRVRSDGAIVMRSVELHSAPDELSPVSRMIEAGEKVRTLDQLDGFVKVRLVNFEVGWIPESVVEGI